MSIQMPLPLLDTSAPWRRTGPSTGRRGVEYFRIPTHTILNPPASTGMPFWTLNPYVGCEFGCAYCYARDTHRHAVTRALDGATLDAAVAMDLRSLPSWLAFERRILVKHEAPRRLAQSVSPSRIGTTPLVIGSATDPWQPAEREFGVTRRILQVLGECRGLVLTLITKSPLILRDLDLLARLARQHTLSINISLITADAPLARRLEPRTPIPGVRLRTLRTLTDSGLQAGLLIAPVLPGITDSHSALSTLVARAAESGAAFVGASPLRLGPAARARFLPLLQREFPDLAPRYERHYAHRNGAARTYRRALERRMNSIRLVSGVPRSPLP